mgnify:CR=1 FL=1
MSGASPGASVWRKPPPSAPRLASSQPAIRAVLPPLVQVAQATANATTALSDLTSAPTRSQTVESAYQIYQQAVAAKEVAEKTYGRLNRLYNEGVVSAQKRDEAQTNWRASDAQARAAKAQYDMAASGARAEDRTAAAAQVRRLWLTHYSAAVSDTAKRVELYQTAQKKVLDDSVYAYLYQKSYSLPMRDSVKGYVFNPMLEQVFNLGSMSK